MGSEDDSSVPGVAAESLLSRCAGFANLSLHRSGRLLSHSDVALLKENIPPLEEELSRDSGSPNLSAQLTDASALADLLALHNALISPVRRLYTEILSEIFLLALPDGWLEEFCGTVIHPCTRVCHVWREVALGTSLLWSTIRVNIDSGTYVEVSQGLFTEPLPILSRRYRSESPNFDRQEDDSDAASDHDEAPADEIKRWEWIAKTYIERSAQTPLTIWYRVGLEFSGDVLWKEASWRLLLREQKRWSHATIQGPVRIFCQSGPWPSFPLLESLALFVYQPANNQRQPLQFFHNAPCLRRLKTTTNILPYQYDPEAVVAPLWNLSEARMGEYTFHWFDEGCTILKTSVIHRHCAATLEVGTVWAYEEEKDLGELPLLSKDFPILRLLEMADYGSEFCTLVRSAPLLERVSMKAIASPTPLPHVRHLVELLSRTACVNLTSLTLVSVQATPTDVIDCLKVAHTLTELCITDWDSPDCYSFEHYEQVICLELFRALTRSDETPASLRMLPNLERLELLAEVAPSYEEDELGGIVRAVLDMVYSRVHPRDAEDLRALRQFRSTIEAFERITVEYVREHQTNAGPLHLLGVA
ncbi:hypothetical protein K525DRAFT_265414 [Schizophyllum commune Loenen D]|nr:hypothetical protein K525DRAFT_265414 [Schizophyllum commune Loenen D]